MRIARNLLLVALTAVAAMAFVSSASAHVEITQESDGSHCTAVTVSDHGVSGGCALAATSDAQVELRSLFGTMILCDNAYEARTDENGGGYIYNQTFTNCSATISPCTEGDGHKSPWRTEVSETGTGTGAWQLEAQFCVVAPIIGTVNCHLNAIGLTQVNHNQAKFASNTGGSHKFCEGSATNAVLGNWTANADASHPGLEINHGS